MKSKLGRTFSKVVTRRSWPRAQCASNSKKVISLRPSHSPSARNNATSTASYLTRHQDLPNVSTMQKLPMMNGGHGDTSGLPFLDYAGDEDVDTKAAQYILYVQERFKQERESIPTLFN